LCTICLVEDDPAVRDSVALLLRVGGYEVTEYASARRLLEEDSNVDAFDCLILDMSMPGLSGLELTELLRARNVSVPVVMTSGSPHKVPADRIRKASVRDLLARPFADGQLLESVRLACARGN
jgi:two-component system response regulator FixJ